MFFIGQELTVNFKKFKNLSKHFERSLCPWWCLVSVEGTEADLLDTFALLRSLVQDRLPRKHGLRAAPLLAPPSTGSGPPWSTRTGVGNSRALGPSLSRSLPPSVVGQL